MNYIYINGKFLTQGITGVQRYAGDFCRSLKRESSIRYIILAPRNIKVMSYHGIKVKKIGCKGNIFWEQFTLPFYLILNKKKPLLLNLCNTAPIIYFNKITWIHDVAFKKKEWTTFFFRLYYNLIIKVVIQTSKHIFTVSNFSKDELLQSYKIDRIDVLYCGTFFKKKKNFKNKNLNKKPYLFSYGTFSKRKNIDFLIDAFKSYNIPCDLKIPLNLSKNLSFDKSKLKNFIPFSNDTDLKKLLENSTLFASASHYEGFNLPILEAQALGIPVMISDIPVHREIYGNSAIYFNQNDKNDFSSKLIKFLKDRRYINEMKKRSIENSTKYKWNYTYQKFREILIRYKYV
jgi:glycosyltransferase involved in cell wall biosynthesis